MSSVECHADKLKETDWYKNGVQRFMDTLVPEIEVCIDLCELFPHRIGRVDCAPKGMELTAWTSSYYADNIGFASFCDGIPIGWTVSAKALQVCGDLMEAIKGSGYEIVKIGPAGATLRSLALNDRCARCGGKLYTGEGISNWRMVNGRKQCCGFGMADDHSGGNLP